LPRIVTPSPSSTAGQEDAARVFACLPDLIVCHGQSAPGRKAILAPGHSALTFGSLLRRVTDAVAELRSLGVGRGDRVAVVLPNGPETAVAMLAVACGAVCVPLHPGYTADEWQNYLGDLRLSALLTRPDMDTASRGVAHSLGIPVIDLSPKNPAAGPGAFGLVGPAARQAVGGFADSSDDAFILLTSGTTARAKLVPLTHAAVCRSAFNAAAALSLTPRDRLLNVLPLFHAHGLISALLTALSVGSGVVCTSGFDAAAFFGWLSEFRPTWYTAVPAVHRALLLEAERQPPDLAQCSLRVIRSASSSLPTDVLSRLESLFGVPVIETYGMTEAASQIAANPLQRRKPGSVGCSAGAEIAITDDAGRSLPAGERGEIVLRGPAITRGYDGDPAANAAAFRDGWFRTGDVGFLDHDGYLFIAGRIKDLINRGGQKIAPVEVEETLLRHPDVVDAAVFSVPHRRLGEDVAAVVVLRAQASADQRELRDFARQRLARFKVPGLIRIVPKIPKGPSGKINRGGLAAALSIASPAADAARGSGVGPRSELERSLAAMWRKFLEIASLDADQDVFALGADSLAVTQMLLRLRARFGVTLSFRDLFEAPSVATLAARIGKAQQNSAAASLSLGEAPAEAVPLSLQQQRIHMLGRLDPSGHMYHVLDVVRLSGPLDPDVLEASLRMLCERHEVLRSTFHEQHGVPVQSVGAVLPRLERLDLAPCAKGQRAAAVARSARELRQQALDMTAGPPLRARLLRFAADDHALLIKLHHLVTDGWSQRLLWDELGAFYGAGRHGPARPPALPIQYRHFAAWQRGWLETRAAQDQLSYWRAQLDGLAELPLRGDRLRSDSPTGRGARQRFTLPRSLSRRLRSLSRAHRVTLFMTLLAAFQCLLHRYTGHEDVAVGSLIANRGHVETECLIGLFANAIVLRTDLAGDPTFAEVLQRVRSVTLDAYRNQDMPIDEIFRTLPVSRRNGRNTLFDVMFILQNAPPRGPAIGDLAAQFVHLDPGVARCDLVLELIDADGSLGGWLEYSTDLFDAATIARMAAQLRRLLEAVVADPQERVTRLDLLPAEERTQLLTDWTCGPTRSRRSGIGTFSARFTRQAEKTPDAIAVSDGAVHLSYRELARRSSAMAGRLMAAGVGAEVAVILLARRSVELLTAMIAVQQAGGAFLPLDPGIPAPRLADIVAHSGAALVLADRSATAVVDSVLHGMPARTRPRVLMIDRRARGTAGGQASPVRRAPSSLACIITTSGSTGVPKGAMIEERGLVNHLLSKVTDLALSAADVIAQTAPQSFVIALWQFLTPLIVGARIHIVTDEEVRDPALLMEACGRADVTVLQVVPSLLRRILEQPAGTPGFSALRRLRALISTGEALPPGLLRDWFRLFPDVPVINAYGASECSDDVATHRLSGPVALATVPIGRPIANTQLHVLDAQLQPVPVGAVGELHVGGIAVGRGYLNDPEQTRRRFLRDPFSQQKSARLYRTGDLARWRADGTLEVLGRVDHQVKIRGHRIEVAEIELALAEHPDVQAAVVVMLARDDLGSEARLVAYVVAAGDRQPEPRQLREALKSRLPAYMIPARFIVLGHIPLTPHGKVDRPALAALPPEPDVAERGAAAPRDGTEQVLLAIWAEVLEVEGFGIFDNFFDLGGHSLLAGQVLARVASAFGVSLPIAALFEAPTIAAFARRVGEAREAPPRGPTLDMARVETAGPQPVSSVQEHVLRLEREMPGLPQFNLPFAYRLQGPLNIGALERSLAEVVRRHEALRTRFAFVNDGPVALVASATEIDTSLAVEDLAAGMPAGDDRAVALLLRKAELRAEQHAWTPFDLTRAPLFRVHLLRLGADNYVLVLILHHVIVDGWSIGLFMDEVSALYAACAAGEGARAPSPPDPGLQFSDFVHWQQRWAAGEPAARLLARWKDDLQDASPLFPPNGRQAGSPLGCRTVEDAMDLPGGLIGRMNTLSRDRGVTPFMTLLTVFKTLLWERTGRRDICVGTVMANRAQLNMERVIGPLENTTVVRTRVDPDLSFRDALARVGAAVLEAHAGQQLPFDLLAARLAEDEGLDPVSLVQAFFVMRNAVRRPFEFPELMVQPFGDTERQGRPILSIDRTWLTIMLKETPVGIAGSCSYKPDLFAPDTRQRWAEDFSSILARAVANPEASLGRLAER
jgi:amino acid adenylation domain-containing protein